jgi:RNA polymerase II transcription mediator complex subunit 9
MAQSSVPSPSATPAPPTNAQTPISIDDISPALFDIVPATERLLSRLLLPSGDTSSASASGGAAATENEPEYKRPLDISHLDAAANPIRVKFTKLRQLVPKLPDIDRTVDEQAEEIEEIEARIAKQKSMLSNLERMMNSSSHENGV